MLRRGSFAIAAVLAVVRLVYAGPPPVKLSIVDGNDIRFHRLSTADGLSQTRVSAIAQDSRGFLWFGTQYGLNRFDGYQFKVFAHDPRFRDSLGGVYISSLFRDRRGTLWIGCDPYLDRFNPVTETFTHYTLDTQGADASPLTIGNIEENGDGVLWVATNKGLCKFDPSSGRTVHYRHAPDDPSTIGSNDVKTIGQDRSGTLWVGHSEGLDRFDRETGKVTLHIPLGESGAGVFFHEDRQGTFWIVYGQYGALATLDRKTNAIVPYRFDDGDHLTKNSDQLYALLEDRTGTMWFGSGANGLLKLDREHHRLIRFRNNPSDPDSLADNRVTALFEDSEGNLWAGLHQAGPNYFSTQPPLFDAVSRRNGVPATGLVGAIYDDREGMLWLGSAGKLYRIDRQRASARIFDRTAGTDVLAIAETGPEALWLATSGRGLLRYDRATGKLKAYVWNPADPNSLSSNMIEHLLVSRGGVLWAATWDGLDRLDPVTQRFSVYKPHRGSRGLNFHAIAEDKAGTLWLGSNQGLHKFDPASGQFTLYNNKPRNASSLSDNRVNSVHMEPGGAMWIGTQNGLDKFDPASGLFTSYYQRDGLAGNVVSCILEDRRGALWMSTNNGVSNFNPRSGVFRNYGIADGLPGTDLTGWGACSQSANGEMFFGGFSGATSFYPDRAADNNYFPPVLLTSFRLFGTEVKLGAGSPLKQSISSASSITLAHWQNFFSFEFAALSYVSASTNRYRYKLGGLDPQWIEARSDRRVATYTSVPPGTYEFRVQGATGRGPWSEPGLALHMEILPEWWNRPWFRISCFLSAGLAIFLLYRLRLHQTMEQLSVRYEERLTERARIARELHDTLLQSFHGLTFRFQAARNLLPDRSAEAMRTLDVALDEADRALLEGRVAIQGLRSEPAGESDLVDLLTAAGKTLASNQIEAAAAAGERAAFGIAVEGARQALHPVLQEEVHRIACEALQNAFHHAEARHVEVELRYDVHEVRLRIRDDGKGIDPKVLGSGGRPGHWGLLGIHERARQIGARLELWSEAGAGTEIELSIPAAIAYGPAKKDGTRAPK